jgi:serine/threonine-protein kinase
MDQPAASPVREGEVIAGKYLVERVLGVGGMGVVVAATHVNLGQRVALKFLLPAASQFPEIVARFAREARAAAGIQCDHVARVLDVDTLPTGAPYMVMEYMDGEDLSRVLLRVGALQSDVAVSYLLQACEALAEAHALGIVHRDLKPANLFLANRPNGEPVVKVLDFGISKATASPAQQNLTTTSAIMGSPLYMSPEQLASAKSVDARSDLWAVGVVLFELLAGSPPFVRDTMPELIAAILAAPAPSIREARPDVPPELAAVIERCLEKDPARRFADVAELARALAPFGPPRSAISVDRIAHVLRGQAAAMTSSAGGAAGAASSTAPMATAKLTGIGGVTAGGVVTGNLPPRETSSLVPAARSKAVLGIVAGCVTIAVALGVTIVLWPSAPVVATPSHDLSPPPPPSSSNEASPTTATPPPAPPPTEVAAVASDSPPPGRARSPTTAPAPVNTHAPRPATKAAPSAAPPPPKAPAVDCTVPYTIDTKGHHVPKPECM